jgi:hypothetical protein
LAVSASGNYAPADEVINPDQPILGMNGEGGEIGVGD